MTTSQEAAAARKAAQKAAKDLQSLKVLLPAAKQRLKDAQAAFNAAVTKIGYPNDGSVSQVDLSHYGVGSWLYKNSNDLANYMYINSSSTIPSKAAKNITWSYKYEYGYGLKSDWLDVPKTASAASQTSFVWPAEYASATYAPMNLNPDLGPLLDVVNNAQYHVDFINSQITNKQNIIDNKNQQVSLLNADGTLNNNAILDFKYNVGSVSEAYLSSSTTFLDTYSSVGGTSAPTTVSNAMQLWQDGQSNKGMIQYNTAGLNKDISAIAPISGNVLSHTSSAFQFQYNPGSIEMTYQGISGVDPNFEGSGLEAFNATGASLGTSSTISFSIIINRMFDMKYYDPTTQQLKAGINADSLYYPRQPSSAEQKDIFNKGTMYDLEYLLRTTLGMSLKVKLNRNSFVDGTTADLGWMTGAPVELHLGKSLRYWVFIGSITVNHVLFNEYMVPIFTNVGVTANRIPDYATPTKFAVLSKTSAGNSTFNSDPPKGPAGYYVSGSGAKGTGTTP